MRTKPTVPYRWLLILLLLFTIANLVVIWTIASERSAWLAVVDPTKCLTNPESGCFLVTHSVYAETFSIENTTIGLIGFSAVLIVLLLMIFPLRHLPLSAQQWEYALLALLGIGSIGALWFLYVQAFILHAFCRLCLWVDLTTLLILGIALLRFSLLPTPKHY